MVVANSIGTLTTSAVLATMEHKNSQINVVEDINSQSACSRLMLSSAGQIQAGYTLNGQYKYHSDCVTD